MSEFQYYEFQTLDRPLSSATQRAPPYHDAREDYHAKPCKHLRMGKL